MVVRLYECPGYDYLRQCEEVGMMLLLGSHHQFSLIVHVAVNIVGSMIDVHGTCHWADCQSRGFCFVMSSSFSASGMRLSSFRMCHFTIILTVNIQYVSSRQYGCLSTRSNGDRFLSVLRSLGFYVLQEDPALWDCIVLQDGLCGWVSRE